MKKFARVIFVTALLALCFMLSACGNDGYVSNYSGTAIVTTKTSNKASISFGSFSGTCAMQLQNNGGGEAFITYNATLEEGSIKVYYDFNGEKLDLFEIGTNGSVEGKTEAFTGNKTIYVIIESDGKCNEGSFSFALAKSEQ